MWSKFSHENLISNKKKMNIFKTKTKLHDAKFRRSETSIEKDEEKEGKKLVLHIQITSHWRARALISRMQIRTCEWDNRQWIRMGVRKMIPSWTAIFFFCFSLSIWHYRNEFSRSCRRIECKILIRKSCQFFLIFSYLLFSCHNLCAKKQIKKIKFQFDKFL